MILAKFYLYFFCQIFEILFVACAEILNKLKNYCKISTVKFELETLTFKTKDLIVLELKTQIV
jgi:hypothetical protein